MKQTICDRCHDILPNKEQKQYPYYTILRKLKPDCLEYGIDLCEDCKQSLRQWMNTFGYNPVEKEGEKQDDEE